MAWKRASTRQGSMPPQITSFEPHARPPDSFRKRRQGDLILFSQISSIRNEGRHEIADRMANILLFAMVNHSSPASGKAFESAPAGAGIKAFLDTSLNRVSGKSALAQAIRYAPSRWKALTRYHHRWPARNVEQRRRAGNEAPRAWEENCLFCASDAGGQRAACIYTIIETCLCRARHRAVYAERRTMPSWLHQVDGCRWFACTSFGIV
jgi:hypothetical protein